MLAAIRSILLLLASLPLMAQQIEFKLNARSDYGYSNTFDNRYRGPLYEDYNLENRGFYRAKKVKSMSVYRVDNTLYRYWEFDTAGTIIKTGAQNFYFTTYTSKQTGPWQALDISTHYKSPGGSMVRCDSIYRNYTRHTIADTVIGWRGYRILVYKTGELINEQNNYYNTKFYNKKVALNDRGMGMGSFMNEHGQWVDINAGGHVFIEKVLKTDYQADKIYKCSEVITEDGFFASCNNGHKDLTQMQLLHHPVARRYNQNHKKNYLTDGEWFDEPMVDFNEPMDCGYNRRHHNEPWVHCSSNSRGLYDTCYIMQLVLDTSRVARIKYEKQFQEAIKKGAVVPEEYQPGPYREEPYKQALYYIRYRYY